MQVFHSSFTSKASLLIVTSWLWLFLSIHKHQSNWNTNKNRLLRAIPQHYHMNFGFSLSGTSIVKLLLKLVKEVKINLWNSQFQSISSASYRLGSLNIGLKFIVQVGISYKYLDLMQNTWRWPDGYTDLQTALRVGLDYFQPYLNRTAKRPLYIFICPNAIY